MARTSPTDLASEAISALASRRLRAQPSTRDAFNIADGYAVSSEVDALLRGRGWRHAGRKLGFTNQSTWSNLGVAAPVWGYVYDHTVRDCDDVDETFDIATAVAPKVELEIVFGLSASPSSSSPSEVLRCIAWAALGFEVIDCHYRDWRFTAADALADLLFHCKLIIGRKRAFSDLREAETWAGSLPANAQIGDGPSLLATGGTDVVLGSPLLSLAALVEMLREEGEPPLGRGELVATGTMTPPITLRVGQQLVGEVAGLGLAPLRMRVV